MTVYGFNLFTKDGTVFIDSMIFDDPRTRDEAMTKLEKKLTEAGIEGDINMDIWDFSKHINSDNEDYTKEMNDLVDNWKTIGEW